jgi:hypothetical protein
MGFENAGRRSYDTRRREFDARAAELRIIRAHQSETDLPGSVQVWPELPLDRTAAFVGDTGDPLAEGHLSHEPKQADLRMKLATSRADENPAHALTVDGPAAFPLPVDRELSR